MTVKAMFTEEERSKHAERIKEREAQKKLRLKERKIAQALKATEDAAGIGTSASPKGSAHCAVPAKKGKESAAPKPTKGVSAPKSTTPLKIDDKRLSEHTEGSGGFNVERTKRGGTSWSSPPNKYAPANIPAFLSPPYEVFLKYLPHDTTEEQVTQFFQGCGTILPPGPKLMREHSTGRVIRGFVRFADESSLRSALARDLGQLGSRSVSVTVATTKGTLQEEGTHTPAMAREVVESLGVRACPNGIFVDGTFGRGGHSRLILEALGPEGTLHAFDMDPEVSCPVSCLLING